MDKQFHILSLGAGVQSTALYLMFMEGIIPVTLDAAVFADTQEEPEGVYRHLSWLQSIGGPTIMVRTVGKLGSDLVNGRNCTGGRVASIPAFTLDAEGSAGIGRRQCSKEYKTEVIDRAIRREILGLQPRQRVPKGVKVFQYIGMSLDEMGRASRVKAIFQKRAKWSEPVFPLIDRFMTRANCLTWLSDRVPHETPRSACGFCPYHSDYEWDRIKREDPASWARAIEVDESLRDPSAVVGRGRRSAAFLHRSCKPLELVQLDITPNPRAAQSTMNFAAECMGMCGV